MRAAFSFAMILAAVRVAAAAEPPLTIERLGRGWEIAGYTSGYDNRSTLLLFRHRTRTTSSSAGPLRCDARAAR